MEEVRTNPNGANGTTSDPREQVMWDIYIANLSKGIDNAYAAAIEANYSEDSARNITMREWFKERLGKLKRKEMLSKAERNLDKTLDLVTLNKEGLEDPQLLKIKVDVSKTIVQTLGKDIGYSTKTETDITSKGEKITWNEQKTYLNETIPKTD